MEKRSGSRKSFAEDAKRAPPLAKSWECEEDTQQRPLKSVQSAVMWLHRSVRFCALRRFSTRLSLEYDSRRICSVVPLLSAGRRRSPSLHSGSFISVIQAVNSRGISVGPSRQRIFSVLKCLKTGSYGDGHFRSSGIRRIDCSRQTTSSMFCVAHSSVVDPNSGPHRCIDPAEPQRRRWIH